MKKERTWWKRPILAYVGVAVVVATPWGLLGILNVRRFDKGDAYNAV